MNATFAHALADARRQWAANPRLRLGLVAIAAIVLVYGALLLGDWRDALAAEYAERTEYLYKMKSLAGQDEWLQRAESAARVRAALEAEIPASATAGLAQAQVQGWLGDIASGMGEGVRVQAGEPAAVDGLPGLWQVPVTVSGTFEPRGYLELLRQIESRATLSVVKEGMFINRANRTFSLTVVSYFRIAERADAGA